VCADGRRSAERPGRARPSSGCTGPRTWRGPLKGRGITRWEAYADLDRRGRRRPLGIEQRRAVWELYSAYDAELRRHGVHDYADVILLAEAEARRQPLADPYAGVIVDEAQDLSASAS
jgi:superfamily I DNA/RNA helicase